MTTKKKITRVIIFITMFAVVFAYMQEIVKPKYLQDSTKIVEGFYALPKNSLDVAFIGSSQMFCSIQPNLLRSEYSIDAYDFGGSSQPMPATSLYLEELLKTQSPKVVCVEMCTLFYEQDTNKANEMSWSYDPLHFSKEKFGSLYHVFNGNLIDTLSYMFPLFRYHTRWNQLSDADFTYPLKSHPDPLGGFFDRTQATPITIIYNSEDPKHNLSIPQKNVEALEQIKKLCRERGIKLVFFKAPNAQWTKGMSQVVKKYCDENNIAWVDGFDIMNETKIDPKTDFFNEGHLNHSGATKFTGYIGKYLIDRYHCNK